MFPMLIAAETVTAPGWLEPVLQYVVAPLLPLITTGVLALLGFAANHLRQLGNNSKAAAGLATAIEIIKASVAHAKATLVPRLQAAMADGVVTQSEAKEIRDEALRLVKEQLPLALQKTLGALLGSAVDTWLSGQVDQAMAEQGLKLTPSAP